VVGFWLGVFENLVTLIFIMVVNPTFEYIFKMTTMILLIKMLPLYLILKFPTHWKYDLLSFFVIFGIYNLYLYSQETTVLEVYERTFTAFYNNTNETPMFAFLDALMIRLGLKRGSS
jgi:hypothetical protein